MIYYTQLLHWLPSSLDWLEHERDHVTTIDLRYSPFENWDGSWSQAACSPLAEDTLVALHLFFLEDRNKLKQSAIMYGWGWYGETHYFVYYPFLKNVSRETPQLVKCSLFKHEDLGFFPQALCKTMGMCFAPVISGLRMQRQEDHWSLQDSHPSLPAYPN